MAGTPNYESTVRALEFSKKVCFFFGNSPMNVATGSIHSTCALIFADINECGAPGSNKLAFPRAMCLMVAIDLLAKMFCGSDTQNKAGLRFIKFTEFALQGTKFGVDIGEKIYAFRNALHHSYRLPTDWKPKGNSTRVAWRFRLTEEQNDSRLTWDDSDCTYINLYKLHEEIKSGVSLFKAQVVAYSAPADQLKFSSMFDKYGWLYVGQ